MAGQPHDPRFDNDGGTTWHRMIRRVVDEYPGRIAIGEMSVTDDQRFARYLRPDELHIGFDARLVDAGVSTRNMVRTAIDRSLAERGTGGRAAVCSRCPTTTWYGMSAATATAHWACGGPGRWRWSSSRCRAWWCSLYNGEELGLPDLDLPEWALRDPVWGAVRPHRPRPGRLPGTTAVGGFRAAVRVHRQPGQLAAHAVRVGAADGRGPNWRTRSRCSRCTGTRSKLRQSHPAFAGSELEWYGAPPSCFAFRRKGGGLICALNTSGGLVPLPSGDESCCPARHWWTASCRRIPRF